VPAPTLPSDRLDRLPDDALAADRDRAGWPSFRSPAALPEPALAEAEPDRPAAEPPLFPPAEDVRADSPADEPDAALAVARPALAPPADARARAGAAASADRERAAAGAVGFDPGFDAAGFDAARFDAAGFDAAGFDAAGFDAAGFAEAAFAVPGTVLGLPSAAFAAPGVTSADVGFRRDPVDEPAAAAS
jgi:hypothetical protein